MDDHPSRLPERVPSEPDPPEVGVVRPLKQRETKRWTLSAEFNLRKLKGAFKGMREVTVEKFDD